MNFIDDFDPTIINMDMNDIDEPFEYMQPFFEKIEGIDIKDFDNELFRKYIEELSDADFELLWTSKIADLLRYINDNYLIVDLDEFEKSETDAKRLMFLEYVDFIMNALPYQIVFSKYIKKSFDDLASLDRYLEKKNISDDLAQLLENNIHVINNMYNLIKTTVATSKRADIYMDRVKKLRNYLDHEIDFREYFIDLVRDTDNEQLKNLILKYYENEYF